MLAIVVSSACMMVARITQTVIAARLVPSAVGAAAIMDAPRRGRTMAALDGAVPLLARIGVHRRRKRLPWTHIRQLGLFRVRVDPDMIRRDEIESRHRGLQ